MSDTTGPRPDPLPPALLAVRRKLGRWRAAAGKSRWLPLAAVLLALVPIAVGAVYGYRSTAREMTATVLTKRDHIAHLVATMLTEKLDRLVDVGLSLAARVRFRQLVENGRWREAIQIMDGIPATLPYVERLFLADPRGVLMADTPALPGVRGRNFSHRDWYRGVLATGATHVSEIYTRSAAPRRNVVAVAVPLKDERQALLGILVLQVTLEAFSEWFKDRPADPALLMYIVDGNGQTAFHPEHAPRGETVSFSRVPAVQRALQGRRGVHVAFDDAENEERVSAYAPVAPYGWGVVVDEPAAAAFAARDAQLRRVAIVSALMLLLSGLAAYLLLRAREQARRKADLELLVAERTGELQMANRELQAFSYSVSHDLRAPLRSIDGFSRVLLDDCSDKLPPPYDGYLGRIRAATQRMGELIDDLLKLSRVTRAEMHPGSVDLSALAQAIIEELRRTQPRQVTVAIQPGLAAVGDPPLLRAVLENLLGNAWKFTGKTAAPRIEFGMLPDVSPPTYFVRDNGAGFDMAYAEKLFGAFQRLHSMDDFPGTGVGLATVQRVVRRHGGRIWADAAVGRGATFYFTFGESRQPESYGT